MAWPVAHFVTALGDAGFPVQSLGFILSLVTTAHICGILSGSRSVGGAPVAIGGLNHWVLRFRVLGAAGSNVGLNH